MLRTQTRIEKSKQSRTSMTVIFPFSWILRVQIDSPTSLAFVGPAQMQMMARNSVVVTLCKTHKLQYKQNLTNMHTDMTTLTHIDSRKTKTQRSLKNHRRVVGLVTVPPDELSEAGPKERLVQDCMSRTTLVVCRTVTSRWTLKNPLGSIHVQKFSCFLPLSAEKRFQFLLSGRPRLQSFHSGSINPAHMAIWFLIHHW